MSLSKKMCLRSDSRKRQSFSDRICDDLSEVLLKYLPLEDKLRFRSVSKQFQRTVFKRQHELGIIVRGHKVILEDRSTSGCMQVHFNSFKAFLKKWSNITSIDLEGASDHSFDSVKINQVCRLIIKNCNNLSEVFIWEDIILNERIFDGFIQKFAPKMKCLRFDKKPIDFILFPNIEKIWIKDLINEPIMPQLKLAKLKQLYFELDDGQEHLLQTFIDYFPKLTHLKMCIRSKDENAIYKSLENISNLKHLIHFDCSIIRRNNNRFCDLLNQMRNNCQNLKSISCDLVINDQNSDLRQLFSQLKAFPLKKLKFSFFSVSNEDNIDVNQLFSFELFKGFENITHLRLCFGYSQSLKESILKEIDINLPNLQYLEINNKFDTTPERVTQMADILSRLLKPQTIELYFKSGVDFNPIEEQITKKCRKIGKIEIGSDSDLEGNNSSDDEPDAESD